MVILSENELRGETMNKIACLNLADRMNGIYEKDATFSRMLNDAKKKSGYDRFERVYVGSSFCAQYFLRASKEMMTALKLFCEKERTKITLVLPMFSQKYITAGKQKIEQLLACGSDSIDEITVNDFGMMEYVKKQYEIAMNLGRLLSKDYREKRYEEYFNTTLEPKLFNNVFLDYIKAYPIQGMELDATHHTIDLRSVPEQYIIGIHYPYCYQTVGNICETASSYKELSHKFRPNAPCDMECESMTFQYMDEENNEYLKRGRSVFFTNEDCNIIGRDEIRLIYSEAIL